MNRQEAIKILKHSCDYIGLLPSEFWDSDAGIIEAIDMAIEALKAEPNKAVPLSLADVYKWERDIALSQLEEYGICFGEKKRDMVEVVRCKDCRWYQKGKNEVDSWQWCMVKHCDVRDDDYCSYGCQEGGDSE